MYFSTTVGALFMVNVGKIKHTPSSVMGHEIHETPGEIGNLDVCKHAKTAGRITLICIIWVFPKIRVFPPKWMVKIMENPIKMDDLEVPLFLETSI